MSGHVDVSHNVDATRASLLVALQSFAQGEAPALPPADLQARIIPGGSEQDASIQDDDASGQAKE